MSKYHDSTQDENAKEWLLKTAIFATNIHCSNCKDYIERAVRESIFGSHVESVNVSIVSGEILLSHEPDLSIKDICRVISDAAFDVEGALTVDQQQRLVSELRYKHIKGSFFQDALGSFRSTLPHSTYSQLVPPGTSSSLRSKRKRHYEICLACQKYDTSRPSTLGYDENPDSSFAETKILSFCDKAQTTETAVEAEKIHETTTSGPSQWRCELSIGGMTCSACTNSVKDGLLALKFVKSVQINLLMNSAIVYFTGDQSKTEALIEAVEEKGFDSSIHDVKEISLSSNKNKGFDRAVAGNQRRSGSDNHELSSTPRIMKASLSIGGMTCSACTKAIESCLGTLTFIHKVTISLLSNSAEVLFEGENNLEQIVTTIEDIGYNCSVESIDVYSPVLTSHNVDKTEPLRRQIQVLIEGFFCENCPERVVEGLRKYRDGCIEINQAPTFKRPVLTISYEPDHESRMTIRDVLQIVVNVDPVHFRPSIFHPISIEERSRQIQREERKRLLFRLLLSAIVVVPTFLIGVVFMDLMPSDHYLHLYFMQPMWSGAVPRAQWALLFLATPVYIFAADIFHRRACKEIRALWHPQSRAPISFRFLRFGSMNLLVSAGTTVAYISSLALLIADAKNQPDGEGSLSSSTYFDSVVFLTFFILIGRVLEAYSKSRAGDAISLLADRKPRETVLIDGTGNPATINADLLEIGDNVLVAHGQSPAGDGILIESTGLFDESSLTGESIPVEKKAGDEIWTGTVNLGKPVEVKITKIGGTSMIDQIINVVREGQTRRAPIESIADVITGYFVPVITAMAMFTFVIWVTLGYSGTLDRRYLGNESGGWAFWSLEFAIAVFVVACPCGIGLAAPTAMFVGSGLAARHGILVRGGGEAFENVGDLDAIVFDKTGTLTEGGNLKVTAASFQDHTMSRMTLLPLIHNLEMSSAHPIARAVSGYIKEQICSQEVAPKLREQREIPGHGIEGTVDTTDGSWQMRVGSLNFISAVVSHDHIPVDLMEFAVHHQKESRTIVSAALKHPTTQIWSIVAIFAVEDTIRSSAGTAIDALKGLGLEIYMLTGDNWTTARSVAANLGIKPDNVFAGVLPTEKAEKIEWLQVHCERNRRLKVRGSLDTDLEKQQERIIRRSKWYYKLHQLVGIQGILHLFGLSVSNGNVVRHGESSVTKQRAKIAFVGDGINDAPALSKADISISPSHGAPIATNSASFILMSSNLMAIPELFSISARVLRRVKFNFAWALLYNTVLIPVAAGVLFKTTDDGFRLGPVWGSLAMALSSVSVVISSLLLRWERPWSWPCSTTKLIRPKS